MLQDVPLANAVGEARALDKQVSDLMKYRRQLQASDISNKREQVQAINAEIKNLMYLLNQAVAKVLARSN